MPEPRRQTGVAGAKARALARKLEFGDALLFPYVVVFARQCLWAVESDAAAWALTLAASALLWLAHVRAKPKVEGRTPRAFWLIVGLPLLAVFAMRAAFPDFAFDVVNHRLIQAERSLRGVQLPAGDFFPTIFPFNPAPDMLTGIFRHLLGYRLGTVVNLLALVWAGTVVEKFLRPFVVGAAWRCTGVLLALFTEHALFQINNYMVDLLALPLVLEATRLALQYDESRTKTRDLLFSALLLGGATALKLTNAAMVIPVLVAFAFRVFSSRRDEKTRKAKAAGVLLLSAVFFLLPILPHAIYIYRETGSPVFPLYNNFIESPLWPSMTPYDARWGPRDARETLLWPLLAVPQQGRLSELGVYSGRITLGIIAALLCLLLPRVAPRARLLALVVLLGSLLWSATSGYARYAIFVEVVGGVLLVYLARYAAARATPPRLLKVAVAALPLCLLAAQAVVAASHVRQTEWGLRPTVFDDAVAYRKELRWTWRDRELMDFQTAEGRALFGQVDAWIVSSVKTNGVEALLRPDVPALAVNNSEYFVRPKSRRRFARALEALRGKRVYSLSLMDNLDAALDALKQQRLTVGEVKYVIVPFFSARTRLHMALIGVGLPERRAAAGRPPGAPVVTEATAPLDRDAFLAGISVPDAPAVLRAGQRVDIRVTVRNLSEFVWPARVPKGGYAHLITVSNAWFDADGSLVDNTDGKSLLPHDLWPGEETSVPLALAAPDKPGEYILEIDLVQEGITWFKEEGSETWRVRIKVE